MERHRAAAFGRDGLCDEARDLIGLPTDGTQATVEPGNHSNYDVFVLSTSVNRKLVRGTKVLVDITQAVNMKPTWEVKQTA